MRTDDKVVATRSTNIDDNQNTRDQRRVGIWWAVIFFLMVMGLMSLGDSHKPHEAQEAAQDTSAAPVDVNPPHFDINRPVGAVEWPGTVGQKQKYLSGQGNSPATEDTSIEIGKSAGSSPDTATDEASRKKSESGATESDKMAAPGGGASGGTAPAGH